MKRRDFLTQLIGGAGALSITPKLAASVQSLSPRQESPATGMGPAHLDLNDLAEYQEVRYPLLAGRFDDALKLLLPRVKDRPGTIAYVIATIYFRKEEYANGIPYALQACRDVPTDMRYRWMLRALTMMAGQAEASIPHEFRVKMPGSPSSPFHFEDVTAVSGAGRLALGRGAAWGDFDNDGREDILVGAERAPFCLFRNLGGGIFEDVSDKMGLIDPVGLGCYASQFVDYDNDGFEDIFLSGNGWGGGGRLFLFHNEGGKRFVDVTESSGLAGPVNAFGSSWADYNNDGRADLAVATGILDPEGGDRIRLYHNEGNGRFREVGEHAGLTRKARWISLTWGDYDGDGRQDLLATSYDAGPFLFRNLGNGKFSDVTVEAGIRTQTTAYTPTFFEFDNDGNLDLFVCTYPGGDLTVKTMIEAKLKSTAASPADRQLLFRNNGDGTFRNVTEEVGITGWYGGMSTQVGDFDNDGFDEITIGTGNPELDWAEPKPLFHNDGEGHFTDVAQSAGLVHFGMLHGTTLADYDDRDRKSTR